jgi:UDP-N-acetylmuramoylalanine-D-glutamate ligase
MVSVRNFKELTFLVYGLGSTGKSVVTFFKKNNIKNYYVWDDYEKSLYKRKRVRNLKKTIKEVNYIILSPGVSLKKTYYRKELIKNKKKIITDIDLIFLLKRFFKSIIVTGTNGKSTTCKIISHLLKKNKYKTLLGGNIGTPILNLDIKKKNFLVIEASSFQLAHSKFISPDYALLLNITNDHLDWHGSMKNYINSKFKIFKLQRASQYALLNKKLKLNYKRRSFSGKLIVPETRKEL